ncbi:MAG TPA: hypothetical protein VGH28_05780 [Polyangiaceae bacterium]|jgi:hypothetical protein
MRSHEAQRLIEAAKRDAPGPALEGAILGALGVAAVATAAPSFAVKLWSALKHAAASKLSIGLVAVAAASGAYEAGRLTERATHAHETPAPIAPPLVRAEPAPRPAITTEPTPTIALAQTLPAATTKRESPPKPETKTATATEPATETSAPAETATDTVAAATVTAAAPAPTSLAEEVASVQRARSRVLAHDGRGALDALDAYDARYPTGELREEALALRVRAARLAGDDATAKRALDQLATRFPTSVQLRALQNAP